MTATDTDEPKPKLVILGGGVGAMTAAFELSADEVRDNFSSITVYQLGWRLGGKGASGRGVNDRIEEHGLHIWFGFYENAFRMMRACYEELGRSDSEPLATVEEAFERANTFIVEEYRPHGWRPWIATFPEDERLPGDPTDPTPMPSMWEYMRRSLELSVRVLASLVSPTDDPAVASGVRVSSEPEGEGVVLRPASDVRLSSVPLRLGEALRVLTGDPGRIIAMILSRALRVVDEVADEVLDDISDQYTLIDSLIAEAVGVAKRYVRSMAMETDAGRRSFYLVDIMLACARGILRHGLVDHPDGFDAIDDFNFADWLELNGADEESARSSLVTTVVYDLAFAYRDGDPAQPSFSAASALQGLFRLFFTYRGAIAYRMMAGMGDVVFAPLFEVLRKRGVEFCFFHEVESLNLDEDGTAIGSITISRQADLIDPSEGYDPLVPVKGLPCWPANPRWEQLKDGDRLKDQMVNFESFWSTEPPVATFDVPITKEDRVVLGISLGALPHICEERIKANPAWYAMIRHVGTIQTQSFQLWLSKPMDELTELWNVPRAIVGGYIEPFDTYADMEQLIPFESFPPGDGEPKAIAYFCNAMPDTQLEPGRPEHELPVQANDEVRANAIRFLREDMVSLWPGAVLRYPTDFRWDLLVPRGSARGDATFDSQFHRANIDPSERYVLSLPGTARYRLDPGDCGYPNLVLAGDWTRCGLNSGCVESAVISGMLAANAITGRPRIADIVGYRDS